MPTDKEQFRKNLQRNLVPRSKEDEAAEKWRTKNHFWLSQSGDIAMLIMDGMEKLNMNSPDLARALNRSQKYVEKMLKEHYNFIISTICKLQEVLDIEILGNEIFLKQQS